MDDLGDGPAASTSSGVVLAWLRLPAPGAWIEDAACARTDPPLRGVFTQEAPTAADLAATLRVYRSCPVVAACGAYGRETRGYGTWGGHLLRNGQEVG